MICRLNIILLIIALTYNGCNPQYTNQIKQQPKPFGSLQKQQFIESIFKDNPLDLIEGIWVWDNNQYEVAIVKNNTSLYAQYDYVGVLTETRNSNWQIGEVKLLLKKTVSEYIYSVIYYMGEKSDVGTSITMPNENMIEMVLPTRLYGEEEKTILIRSYPLQRNEESKADNNALHSGTGFFVSNQIIATNYHVIAEAKEIILNINSKQYEAKLLIKDVINDLALLQIDFKDNQLEKNLFLEQVIPLPFGEVNLVKEGDNVFTIGYPLIQELGRSTRVSEGIINSIFGINDDPRMFQISIPIQPGNSGGPMFNQDGEVVGIITSTINNAYLIVNKGTFPQNVNFSIKINYLNNLLQLLPEKVEPVKKQITKVKTTAELVDLYKSSVVLIEAR